MKNRTQIHCTALFFDIRNFTTLLDNNYNEELFFRLVENIYEHCISMATEVAGLENFYINSTGDGFLIIFFGNEHYLKGFLFSLLYQKKVTKIFDNSILFQTTEGDYHFGIGIESGYVKKVSAKVNNLEIVTYLGNVINLAARLEALTKDHARAPIIYGPEINELIVKKLFDKSYKKMIQKAKNSESTEKAQILHEKMSKINSKMLSSYLFEHKLKGVDTHTPTFRISPTLFATGTNHLSDFFDFLPQNLQTIAKKLSKDLI